LPLDGHHQFLHTRFSDFSEQAEQRAIEHIQRSAPLETWSSAAWPPEY
jgi:hypothetical protein